MLCALTHQRVCVTVTDAPPAATVSALGCRIGLIGHETTKRCLNSLVTCPYRTPLPPNGAQELMYNRRAQPGPPAGVDLQRCVYHGNVPELHFLPPSRPIVVHHSPFR